MIQAQLEEFLSPQDEIIEDERPGQYFELEPAPEQPEGEGEPQLHHLIIQPMTFQQLFLIFILLRSIHQEETALTTHQEEAVELVDSPAVLLMRILLLYWNQKRNREN